MKSLATFGLELVIMLKAFMVQCLINMHTHACKSI